MKKNIWKYMTITLLVFIVGVSGFSYYTGYIMPDTGGKQKILDTYYHFDTIIPIGLLSILVYMISSQIEGKGKK
ncbi:hypothetical protein [Enterococcus casseliflavus]|uniref:hypothetical protein n=1 Tax=Enterococcus casseliflavus TaxID=37734 RepID=UPI002543CEEF|nr:hypothetical protein [Enterococcus casseliflavus]MDK4450050.1 hypothetical protein [Enterococcus casseliflavus]